MEVLFATLHVAAAAAMHISILFCNRKKMLEKLPLKSASRHMVSVWQKGEEF